MNASSGEVTPFNFNGAQVRTVTDEHGDPWFVASDVCAVLGFSKPRDAVAGLDADERGSTAVDTLGGRQTVTTVSESGLYSLMFRSRSHLAQPFRRWVTHEVLPALRRTGLYSVPAPRQEMDELEVAERYVAALKRNRELEATNRELAPKAEAADVLTNAAGDFPMGAVANMLDVGRTTLFRWLRDENVLQKDRRPYQPYAAWFRVVAGTHGRRDGSDETHYTTYVLPGGLIHLYDLLKRRGYQVRRPEPQLALTVVS